MVASRPVSHSTFYVTITTIFPVINMTVFSLVGAWRRYSASSIKWYSFMEEDSVTQFVVFLNSQETLGDTGIGRSSVAQRHTRALRSPSRTASVRTLETKPDVPSRGLATTTRTRWPPIIHLVLLKRSIAHHPSNSGRSDSFG